MVGIHDFICLAQKLIAIKNGSALDVLDEYERQRRPIAVEDIGGQSHKNRARMISSSSAERLKHLRELQEISDSYEKSRKFLLKSSMIEGLKIGDLNMKKSIVFVCLEVSLVEQLNELNFEPIVFDLSIKKTLVDDYLLSSRCNRLAIDKRCFK